MDILRRVVAVYLALIALAAFTLLIITPLYHDGSAEYPHWQILNYFMAVGVVVVLALGLYRRRKLGDDPDMLEYLRTSFVFYGSIVLTMLFFWEWFWTLDPESETGDAVTSHLIYFPMMDSLFVVLALSTARYLWNRSD